MKTITLKADSAFDSDLTRLAHTLHMTKSGVIRAAVKSYKKKVEREALARKIHESSLKVRGTMKREVRELDATAADGL